jgi:hypothetical protein
LQSGDTAHEHACSRCRFLRVDPAQLPRIEEMTSNAEARLAEAQDRAWLGEVAALEESLKHLRQRHAEAESQLAAADAPARRSGSWGVDAACSQFDAHTMKSIASRVLHGADTDAFDRSARAHRHSISHARSRFRTWLVQ